MYFFLYLLNIFLIIFSPWSIPILCIIAFKTRKKIKKKFKTEKNIKSLINKIQKTINKLNNFEDEIENFKAYIYKSKKTLPIETKLPIKNLNQSIEKKRGKKIKSPQCKCGVELIC